MTDVTGDPDRAGRWPPSARLVGLWIVASLPGLLALASLAGLGLTRGLSAPAAFTAALALVALPSAGLARITPRGGPAAGAIACAAWSIAVLLAMPVYFPGERAQATTRGLQALAAPAGGDIGRGAGRLGRWLADSLGHDAPRQPVATRIEPSDDGPPSDRRATAVTATAPPRAREPARRSTTVVLPYEGDQTSLRVRVDVDGPEIGEQLQLVFDTGATFTTLDRASLERIGVAVSRDAPRITLRTANGEIEAPLVLVDAVWLGDEPIEWVTVAVCDSCAHPPVAGLLGLNVTGRFRVSIDHDRRRVELSPRRRGDDRALDVAQWLDVHSRATRDWMGTVDVTLTATNHARQPIEEAVIDLSCGSETFAIQIDDIPARGDRATEIALPRGTDCSQQALAVSRARWRLDRF